MRETSALTPLAPSAPYPPPEGAPSPPLPEAHALASRCRAAELWDLRSWLVPLEPNISKKCAKIAMKKQIIER